MQDRTVRFFASRYHRLSSSYFPVILPTNFEASRVQNIEMFFGRKTKGDRAPHSFPKAELWRAHAEQTAELAREVALVAAKEARLR